MPKSYKKLSREEWREISNAVLLAEKSMNDVVTVLGGKFPVGLALDRSIKIFKKISFLKSILDGELGQQYGRSDMTDEEFFSYFYPRV